MIIQCPQCQSRHNTDMHHVGDAIHCRCGTDIQVPDLPNLARSWKCPNCNGNVDPTNNNCEYCDAYIAFARCPACFSIAPYDGAKYCGECGELLTLPIQPVLKKEDKLPCPRCENDLKTKVLNSRIVDYCADCGGVWLGHYLFDDLLKNIIPSAIATLGISQNNAAKSLTQHKVRYLRCPECDSTMSRHNFLHDSNIILDQCGQHGIWFDKQELAATLEYMRSSRKNNPSNPFIKEGSHLKTDKISRSDDEVIEIKAEDLQLLLEEFPHWMGKK